METVSVKIRVSGRVQGVGFRYFTYQQATKLGLAGYVYNLQDGGVEIVASGDQNGIDALVNWLEQGGPPSAKVDRYVVESYSGAHYAKFEIKR